MAQSLAKILLHTVFSTKDRRPFLCDEPLLEELHRTLGGILTKLDCQPLIIGGVEDHVHLLFAHSRTATVADVVKEFETRLLRLAENQIAHAGGLRMAGAAGVGLADS